MKILQTVGALTLAVLLLLPGCDRADSVTTTQGGSPVSETDKSGVTNRQPTVDTVTVSQLAVARCDREVSCSRVGRGLQYVTHEACVDDVRSAVASDLEGARCPSGFDPDQVERCMAALRSGACDRAPAKLVSLDPCRAPLLCAR